jgi:hypothetical protein
MMRSPEVTITMRPLTTDQRRAALEKAAAQRLEREARGKREPLDEWPEGPPEGDPAAIERYSAAFRQWYEAHVGPADG